MSEWNEKHWLRPELFEQPDLMQVKLVLTIETKGYDKDFIKDFIKDSSLQVSERQKEIMLMIADDDTLTSQKISQKTGVSQRTVLNDLKVLQTLGLLAREDGRKEGHWVILKK